MILGLTVWKLLELGEKGIVRVAKNSADDEKALDYIIEKLKFS